MVCVGSPAQPEVSNTPLCRFQTRSLWSKAPSGGGNRNGFDGWNCRASWDPSNTESAWSQSQPRHPWQGPFPPELPLSQEPGTPSQGASGICSSRALDPHNNLKQCEKQQEQPQPKAPGQNELLPTAPTLGAARNAEAVLPLGHRQHRE